MTAVLVTGMGVLAPNGRDVDEFWSAVLTGRSGIGPFTRFDPLNYPVTLAGQIDGFDPVEHIPKKLIPQTDISTQFALAAAAAALADAEIDPATLPDYAAGVITSNATGGFAFTHNEFRKLWAEGPESVSVYESFAWFYAVNTGQISIQHGLRGPGCVLVSEQAGGLDAIGNARRTARLGTPLVVTGGVDSSFDPWGWISHIASGRLTRATDPAHGYLPFDAEANGYVPGEGGAILVLEDTNTAQARGTSGYGEIAGYAATFDPRPGSGRPPGLRRAAELAIADAGLWPVDIDVVFADSSGLPELDAAEAEAIRGMFGPGAVPVTAPKALTGRLYAGGGPLDVVTALLAIQYGIVPATANTTSVPSGYGIDLVLGEPRPAELRSALVLARGRGGFNSAIVVRSATGPRTSTEPSSTKGKSN